jgi:hypothetical protein
MPPPFSSSSDDEADFGSVIGPDDPAKVERALAEALAQTTTEQADRLTALHAVKAFQEREAAGTQRLAEAARILLPSAPLLGCRHRRTRSPAVR